MEVLRTRRAHAYRSRRAALICQTSHKRHAFGPQLWTSCPAGTALPSRVQQRCPRAPSPEPCKGRRPKNRHSKKRRNVFLLWFLACLCRGFPGSRSLVLRPCPFGFLFVFVPPHVSFYWPRASCSSSQREGRRVKPRGTDPRTGLFRYPLHFVLFNLVFAYSAASVLVGEVSEAMYECGCFSFFAITYTLCLLRFGTRDGRVTNSAHLRRLHSVSCHPSFCRP